MKIVIEYYIDSDDMTNEEYEDQDVRRFEITEDQLKQYLLDNVMLKPSEWIVADDLDISIEN